MIIVPIMDMVSIWSSESSLNEVGGRFRRALRLKLDYEGESRFGEQHRRVTVLYGLLLWSGL